MKDEAENFPVRKTCTVFSQTHSPRLIQNPFSAQSTAIVRNFNDDVARLVAGSEPNEPGFIFAGNATFLHALQAVISRVTHHVHHGVSQLFYDVAIKFSVGADRLQFSMLAGFASQV